MGFKVGIDCIHKPIYAGNQIIGDYKIHVENVVHANEVGRSRRPLGDKGGIHESIPEGDYQYPQMVVVLAGKYRRVTQKHITAGELVFGWKDWK